MQPAEGPRAMDICSPAPGVSSSQAVAQQSLPTLRPIERPEDEFHDHVKVLVRLASRRDDGTNWLQRFGTESKLGERQLLGKVLQMPKCIMSEKSYPTIASLMPALIAYSIQNRPNQLSAKRMKKFEALLWNTPCSRRVPVAIRNENLFERCGVTLMLYRNLITEINKAYRDGSLTTDHFGPAVRYQSGKRINIHKGTLPPDAPLSVAIETTVRRHLEYPLTLAFVRLLGGVWPYSDDSEYGATYWFDVIMNHICCYANNGSLIARLNRSRCVMLGSSQLDDGRSMSDFQFMDSFNTSTDLFITGIGESAHQWGAHGNTEKYGHFVSKLGEGSYAIVAKCVNRSSDAYGRMAFALRAQTFYLIKGDKNTDDDEGHMEMIEVLAGTCVAKALTELVSPYDGYVKTDGSVHAASIARLLDHQMVLGELQEMVPGLEHALGRHKNVRPWQLEVFEYVDGVRIESMSTKAVAGSPGALRDHNWYCAAVAHAVATLRSFEGVKFTHADLTLRNIMVSELPDRLRDYAKCAVYPELRPGSGGDLYIPLQHTNNCLIKLIDFSLSSIDSPKHGLVGREPGAMRILKTYHPAFDLHMLGCWFLWDMSNIVARIRSDAPSSERYQTFGGVTSATIKMFLDMLMPSYCTLILNTEAARTEKFTWKEWDYVAGKSNSRVITQETANYLYASNIRTVTELGNTLRINLRAYETTGTMPNFDQADFLRNMRNCTMNAAQLAYYCTVATPRSVGAVAEFLALGHFDQYRIPMKEGVVTMNRC